ncbi:hypothetical protein QQ045_008858 [Rhodiola kirilowii]
MYSSYHGGGGEIKTVLLKTTDIKQLNWETHLNHVPRKLSVKAANRLCEPISSLETQEALFQMAPTKAPGLDGFPALFFSKVLDFDKTFSDKECHEERMMIKLGLPHRWIEWVMMCIKTVKYKAISSNVRRLLEFLKEYELVAGQRINFSKSKIVFSKNVTEGDKNMLAEILGVNQVQVHSRYLGLPIVFSHNKVEVFNYIIQNTWKRILGWKESHPLDESRATKYSKEGWRYGVSRAGLIQRCPASKASMETDGTSRNFATKSAYGRLKEEKEKTVSIVKGEPSDKSKIHKFWRSL